MKKGLPYLLIVLALAHVAGIMPFYFYLLDGVKGEMTIQLRHESNLEKIIVTNAEYNNPSIFLKTDDCEFTFKGQMYDFKSMTKSATGYIYYGLSDNKETHLIGFLKSIFEQGDNHSNSSLPFDNLLKNFSADFIPPVIKDITVSTPVKFFYFSSNLIIGTLPGHRACITVPPDFS